MLPMDIWTVVAGYCDAAELVGLEGTCKWMAKETKKDWYWEGVVTSKFSGCQGLTGYKGIYKEVLQGTVQEIDLEVVKSSGGAYSHAYRCELMLKASEGVFCTASGVCSAEVVCQPKLPFLLTEIHAKGAGRGFSSPLRKFKVHDKMYTLTTPSDHHVFVPPVPALSTTLTVQLLEGTNKDENIDTEYIGFFGISLPSVAAGSV
eukprot:TRINITY_DN553_c0_g1_i1.p1 TRINITY_DN553_c0_g1~~TRINITY_DN553_c0_g1_i1.p1  ORF type:complete len:222 (+),score=52.79 TRINITY_DN553_c0_g1_i1:57-668(+)